MRIRVQWPKRLEQYGPRFGERDVWFEDRLIFGGPGLKIRCYADDFRETVQRVYAHRRKGYRCVGVERRQVRAHTPEMERRTDVWAWYWLYERVAS